jgi:hypothetical protein
MLELFFIFIQVFAMYAPIAGYEGLYELSTEGRVRNARTTRLIPVKSGRVTLSKYGEPAAVLVRDLTPSVIAAPAAALPSKTSRNAAASLRYGPWANTKHVPGHNGAAGEHLVCALLERCGIFALRPPYATAEYDVIGDFGRGHFFTVQVKATSCAAATRRGDTPAYVFAGLPANQDACDAYAFVALDTLKVVFVLASECAQEAKRFMVVDFEAKALDSLQSVLFALHAR